MPRATSARLILEGDVLQAALTAARKTGTVTVYAAASVRDAAPWGLRFVESFGGVVISSTLTLPGRVEAQAGVQLCVRGRRGVKAVAFVDAITFTRALPDEAPSTAPGPYGTWWALQLSCVTDAAEFPQLARRGARNARTLQRAEDRLAQQSRKLTGLREAVRRGEQLLTAAGVNPAARTPTFKPPTTKSMIGARAAKRAASDEALAPESSRPVPCQQA